MLNLPGYQILEQIHDSHKSRVYKAYRVKDNQPVILKLLKQDYPTQKEINRYQQEFDILSSLNIESVVKAYALESYQNTLVTILEDFGGTSLSDLLARKNFSLTEFLPLSIKIIETVGQIHAANIIHKDINPSNIVWNQETNQIKIIDFGISSRVSPELNKSEPPNILEGTIVYMSPEQTGRMNRSVDYRTDFYSLGMTFYEMLTGQLPFQVTELTDPMELVHCHIAKQPVSPQRVNPEIPPAVSDIVLKLLAKNAEDRYQSSWGIKADLENCLIQLEKKGAIAEFPLATQDISGRFQIPEKLYGRDAEIQTLLESFERVSKGHKELVILSGDPGIGKSSLAQELYKLISQRQGYLLTGKFNQDQQNLSYLGLAQVFSGLIQQLLTEPETQLNRCRTKLIDSLGSETQIIFDVIPELQLMIDRNSIIHQFDQLDQTDELLEAQVEQVLLTFIRVIGDEHHPIVIFLDDLHWADQASLNLIKLMMLDEQIHNLFIIVAYKESAILEPGELTIKNFIQSLNFLQQTDIKVDRLSLNPLTYDHITALITETLHQEAESIKSLAGIVWWKTAGIPLLVHKFLIKLYEEKFLIFELNHETNNVNQPRWIWNLDEIKTVDITNLGWEIPFSQLKKLPESTQKLLHLAACLGDCFDLQTLSLLSETSIKETFEILWPGIQEGFVLPQSSLESIEIDIDFSELLFFAEFKFSSKLLKEAAYALIETENIQKKINLKIGNFLKDRNISIESINQIFKVVKNLNMAEDLIVNESDKLELAYLNLKAGETAIEKNDAQLAKEYFTHGINFLNLETCWEEQYDLAIALYQKLVELELANRQLETAEKYADLLFEKLKSTLDKAAIAHQIIWQYSQNEKYEKAIVLGKKALQWLGLDLPSQAQNIDSEIYQEIEQCSKYILARKIDHLIHQSAPMNIAKEMLIKLLTSLSLAAQKINPSLGDLLIVKAVNLSLQYGHIPESAYAYAAYGVILGSVFGNEEVSYEFGQLAFNLSKKFNDPVQQCLTYHLYANAILPWVKPINLANSINTQGYQIAGKAEEWGLARDLLFNQCINYFYQGKFLAHLMVDLSKCLEITQSQDHSWTTEAILVSQMIVANLTGQTADKLTFANAKYSESQYLQTVQNQPNNIDLAGLCLYKIYKMQILYLYEDYSPAIILAKDIENIIDYIRGNIANFEYIFYYSLILTALYHKSSRDQKQDILIQLANHQLKLKKKVDRCPQNFRAKFLLIEAEIARITGKIVEAMNLYDYVIQLVQGHEYIQIRALADELAAKFWLAQEKEQFAQLYMKKARACYQMWGAKRKVEDLEMKYPSLLPMNPEEKAKVIDQIKPSSTLSNPIPLNLSKTTTYMSSNSEFTMLDLGAVMKASQAISSEIILDKLLEKLMKILLENAGAQKGFLILENQGKFLIEAEGFIGYSSVPESSNDQTMIQVLQSLSIAEITAETAPLPLAIVNYVIRTEKHYVWPAPIQLNRDSATSTEPGANDDLSRQFSNDPYFQKNQPKSILCAPLMNKGHLDGIIYMENNLTTGVFTPDRLEMLHLLSSQAAISIQNSRYYTNMAALNQAYERFVPRQFLQFLKKKSIVDVQLGDNVEQEMSVLFSDIRGFTTLSESLTPEENFKFINSYLSSMEPAIVEYNGFIDKYIGDAIMALFPGGADDAVQAAITMLRRLSEYNEGRQRAGYVPIEIGIGINTGDLMLGTVGGNSRMDSTVISDAVNLASRLEDLTKVYGVSLLISHQTFLRLSNATNYKLRIIERLTVKGKSHPVAVFEVFDGDDRDLKSQKLAISSLFEEALMLYYRQDYQKAKQLFQNCLNQSPDDRAIKVYLERCQVNLSS